MGTNSVKVVPGGATFQTISAALDSITDASTSNEYELWVSEGTFAEQVTLKPYVVVHGAGPDKTTITQQASDSYGRSGTVNAASNSLIEGVTIVSTGGAWGAYAIPLYVSEAVDFGVSNCTLQSNPDNKEGNNPTGLAVNLQVFGAPAVVNMSSCTIQSSDYGIGLGDKASVNADECTIVAEGGGQTWGAFTSGESKLELVYSKITGKDFALIVDSPGSSITAINCTIDGPLGGDVKVIDNPPPAD